MKISKIMLLLLVIATTIVFSTGCGNNPPTNTTTVVGSAAAPLAPASLSIQAISTPTLGVTLSWTAVTGATSYNIYRSTFPNVTINPGNKINPNPVTQTMIQNNNLLSNTTYYYIVTSVSSSGESGPSAEVYAKPSTGLIGSTVGGTNTNNNPITGIVYGTPNAATPALQIPLLGATVVSNNNSTTTDMNGAYSVGTASNVVELSAAAQGYAAQTMAGVPAATVQNMHLNFLATPISSNLATSSQNQNIINWTPTSSTTVTITLQMASGGIMVPAAGRNIGFYTNSPKVSAWFPSTDANGVSSTTVSFYDGVTTANIAIVASTKTWDQWVWNGTGSTLIPGTWSEFGYSITPSQISAAPFGNTNVTFSIASAANTLSTVTTANMPTGVTSAQLGVTIPFSNGVNMPVNSTWGWSSAPMSLPFNFPSGIAGINQYHAVAYANDQTWTPTGQTFTFASYIGGNYLPGNQTLTMPSIPVITSPTSVNSNLPTTITWNPFVGAQQYQVQIKQGGNDATAPTYEWDGFTNNTSITKPLFYPSNGGNMVPGFYDLTLIPYTQANVGLGTGFPINPLTTANTTITANKSGLNGFVTNPSAPPASSTQLYMDRYWDGYTGQGSMKRVKLTVM